MGIIKVKNETIISYFKGNLLESNKKQYFQIKVIKVFGKKTQTLMKKVGK